MSFVSSGYTGTFAGFSLTAAIFIAGLDIARASPLFATVFGMMLVGFLIQVLAGWIAFSTPNASDVPEAAAQSLALVLVNLCSNLGVSITWLALAPLTTVIGLHSLTDVLIWPLLIMVLIGGSWVALVAYRLTMASALACLTIPVLGIGLPALYRLVAARLWPALWPAGAAALDFAFVAFGATGLIYVLHLGLLIRHDDKRFQECLRRNVHRIALASSQVNIVVVGLTWFAVAMR